MSATLEKPRQTIIGNVYQTNNYDMFTLIDENRDINPTNVDRLVKSMKIKVNICPIIVDSKLRVIDGQHRLEAFKILKLPVIYIIDSNATIDDIQRLNSVSKTWSQKEYLSHYNKRGFKNYKIMHNFILTHELSVGEALLFLNGSRDGHAVKEFQYGKLKIKDMEFSSWFATKVNKIKTINRKLGMRFYRVILSLLKNSSFDLDEFIHKIEFNPTKLVPCSNAKQTRELIEVIYNYKRRKKVNLRF
jgi:hypothetical protein